MVLIYMDTFEADAACIEELGEEYVRYMQRVPRVNFVAGLLRLLVHPGPESTEV
jgi:protein-S-isoprenylcysteine O-methyltransferase Ste14